jgi:ribosomal protein L11 methyltransferase
MYFLSKLPLVKCIKNGYKISENMNCYLFRILDCFSISEAKRELQRIGLHDLYVIEDDASGEVLIGGIAQNEIVSLRTCLLVDRKKTVSWEDQWAQFAQYFRDGKAHIDLEPFGSKQTLLLLPGPGFGDLSHPTTSLMLELMDGWMNGETVLDLGCGSGILSLAALMMGAKRAYGVDIDAEAIKHAQQNAELNRLKSRVRFSSAVPKLRSNPIVLINMILPEQQKLLEENPNLPKKSKFWVTSGLLRSQRKEALSFMSGLRLNIIEERRRGEWLGFRGVVQ